MTLYAFQLGRKRALCLAELVAQFGEKSIVESGYETAIFDIPEPKDAQALQDRLGGTIKVMKVVGEIGNNPLPAIEEVLLKELEDKSGKIQFAITSHNKKENNLRQLLTSSKKIIKTLGLNCRFVNNPPNKNPKPSAIYKAKVIEKGLDLNIIHTDRKKYLGYSVAIQNIDAYSKRDFDKPCRDAKCGMLPPKLAQIMINLAGPNVKTIYDPFCGTGTVMMEGMLMPRIRGVVGSDIEPRMVEFSHKNCTWLVQNFGTDTPFRAFERDARFITKECLGEKVDAIITEGYLGTPVSSLPSPEQREITFRELSNLHLNWLKAVSQITNAPVVMCVAAFRDGKSTYHLPRLSEIVQTSGYEIKSQFLYDRPDQIVARDIIVLEKK